MFKQITAMAVLSAAALPFTAQAVTVNISQSASFSTTAFNVLEQTVVLPSGFTDAMIQIDSVFANDAAVLQVNGVNIVGWGIFGPSPGSAPIVGGFAFSESGPFVPFSYELGHGYSPVAVNLSYAAPFVAGNNTIKLFHNDNGSGIYGSAFSLDSGQVLLSANVTYTAPIPEPGAVWMLLAGLGVITLVRRRSLGAAGS